MYKQIFFTVFMFFTFTAVAQNTLKTQINQQSDKIMDKVIEWRRDFHQHPELGNNELRTSKIIAEHLRKLGLEVKEHVAGTGVIGILKGAKPGPVIALRADMDALPVTERVNVPFKSTVQTEYHGQKTGIMHACGHDSHMAILMGTAEVLTNLKSELKGTVKFIFQPAEEGLDDKSVPFGADGMIKAGCLENPKVDVAFGLHIDSQTPVNTIEYRPGPTMAAVDEFTIVVKGKQTHGAYPWDGIDPIVASSQIVMGLQTIISRNAKLIEAPAVLTVGAFNGGIRTNIVPEEVKMIGTIRTLSASQREMIHNRIKEVATDIAKSAGCVANVDISTGYPATVNDINLTKLMLPTLQETAGENNVKEVPVTMGAEDFSYFGEKVPSLFFFLGGRDPKVKEADAPSHHTPDFYIDESGFELGVKTFCNLVFNYENLKTAQSETPKNVKKIKGWELR